MAGQGVNQAHSDEHGRAKRRVLNWPGVLFIALVVALVGAWSGGYGIWPGGLKRHVIPRHWETVEPGLIYRSGELSSSLVKKTWEKNQIKCVVNLIGPEGDEPHAAHAAEVAARDLAIERNFFPLIGDGTGEIENVVGAVKAIAESRQRNEPVVVHCAAGSYRTGMVVAVYRTLVQGWTGKAAYEEMVSEGVKPGPDRPIFIYLNKNIGEIARRLVEEGVIERVPEPLPVFAP